MDNVDGRYVGLFAYCQELEFKYDILKDALINLYAMTQHSKSGEGMHIHSVVKRALENIKGETNVN